MFCDLVGSTPLAEQLDPEELREVVRQYQEVCEQVIIGIHTGLVVVGELGGKDYREAMGLGETPNLAARLQGLAEPNAVLVSGVTHQLVQRLFACQECGIRAVKGVTMPVLVDRYGFGVRSMGIASSEANALGSSLRETRDGGLTEFGRQVVGRPANTRSSSLMRAPARCGTPGG